MTIVNKGRLKLGEVILRQSGNDWPTAQVLYTSDVLETASNLYFTYARVNATVQPFLTTANVLESSSNLYFTYARANAAIWPSLTAANIANFASTVNTVVQPFLTAANVANFNSTVNTVVQPFLTAANIANFTSTVNTTVQPSLTAANIANFTSTVNTVVQPFLTTANVIESASNLYFTNTRVVSSLIAGNQIIIEANGRISANVTSNPVSAQVSSLSNFTTANLIESSANLYFTNARAIASFTAGKGIIIQENGTIKTATAPTEFNLYIDGSAYGNVLGTMSTMVTMPSATATDRFILRSIHVTNISNTDALLSGNVLYATGNTAYLVNQMPIPVGGVVDLIRKGQLLNPGDKINLQGFNSSGVATSNLLSAMFTYETFPADSSYIGIGETLATSNTNILIYDSYQSASIIESIKIANLKSYNIPVRLYWADANGLVKTHLAYNLSIPSNSSVELLANPKRIEQTDRLYAYYTNADTSAISVFTSARLGATFSISSYSANVTSGSSFISAISTTEAEGTVLYYTIE